MLKRGMMLVGCGCGWFLVTCPQIILEAPRVRNWCFEDPLPHWSRCLISERNWHIHHLRNKPQHQLLFSPRKANCLYNLEHLAEDKRLAEDKHLDLAEEILCDLGIRTGM